MQKYRLEASFIQLLMGQLKEFKWYYLFGVLCLFFTHRIQSELPFLAKELADFSSTGTGSTSSLVFLTSAVGIIFFRTFSRILFFYPARLLQNFLRHELVLTIESTLPLRFRNISSGSLFQHLSNDIDQVRALIGFVGLQGANFGIALIVLIPKIFHFNPKLILALSPMVITFIIFTIIVSRNKVYFKLTQAAQGDVQNFIMESYTGKKTITNFHAEDSFITLFEKMSLKELYYFYRSSLGVSISMPLVSLGVGLSMLWGAYLIKSLNLGAGALIVFSGFIFLFMEPMAYLSWIGVVISRSNASWGRLRELHQTLTTELEAEKQLKQDNPDVSGLNFLVPFWDIKLPIKITPKKKTVFISNTGHGKTEVLLKLADILKLHQFSISYIAQDPYVFNDSILKNIFLGREVTSELLEKAKVYLRILRMDYLNPNLDELLKMEVGENGKRLSGGQAKRLCLIRSLLSEADILIWDDPFSSIDLILEKEILAELNALSEFQSKTLLLTSHRLSTVRHSDEVIFLDKVDGIVESGLTSQLLNTSSKTNEYFQKQMV